MSNALKGMVAGGWRQPSCRMCWRIISKLRKLPAFSDTRSYKSPSLPGRNGLKSARAPEAPRREPQGTRKSAPFFCARCMPRRTPVRRSGMRHVERSRAAMPKRTDISSILIIGAGPIVIGQACEFDYSDTQACKALKQEGYRVVLVNSNPATIMTDPELADATYIEPITPEIVARIIEKERPDALLPTVGGQTALNLALELARRGVLERYGVELIGAN